jgi:hypothetical protein
VSLQNLGFEVVGPRAGFADSWSFRSRTSARLLAGFARNELTPLSSPNALGSADWTASSLGIIADAAVAPDGTTTADALRDNAVNSAHYLRRATATSFTAGKTYTFGFFAKKSTHNYVGAYLDLGGGNEIWTAFDISEFNPPGRVVKNGDPLGNIDKISCEIIGVENVGGGGWKLCATTFHMTATQSFTPAILMVNNSPLGSLAYVGAVEEAWVWGAFLVEGALNSTDDFEAGWGNSPYLLVLDNPTEAVFPSGDVDPLLADGFEKFWSNSPYLTGVVGTSALFDVGATPEVPEDFEEEWGNSPYLLVLGATTAVAWDTLAESAEDLEEEWGNGYPGAVIPVSLVTPGTDVITTSAQHGLAEGEQVTVSSTLTLPAPLIANRAYFVRSPGASTLQLSLTSGGPAVDLTNAGTGSITIGRILPERGIELTVDPGTDIFTSSTPHGFNGSVITLATTHTLPTPLSGAVNYHVVNATPSTFQLSLTSGGSVIDITSAGTGTHGVSLVLASAATTSPTPILHEDFSSAISDKVFTVDPGTDTLTSSGHGLANDTTVKVLGPHGGEIPAGLNPTVLYYVISAAANTFRLSLTSGGSAVDVTSAGVGEQRVRANPALYWYGPDINTTI